MDVAAGLILVDFYVRITFMSENQPIGYTEKVNSPKNPRLFQNFVRTGLVLATVGTVALSDGGPQYYTSETTSTGNILTLDESLSLQRAMDEFIKTVKLKYGIDARIILSSGTTIISESLKQDIKVPKAGPFTNDELFIIEKAMDTVPFCTYPLTLRKLFGPGLGFRISGSTRRGFNNQAGITLEEDFLAKTHTTIHSDTSNLGSKYTELGLKTYADVLKHVYYHECGHQIDDFILQSAYSPEVYSKIVNPEEGSSLVGLVTQEEEFLGWFGLRDFLVQKHNPLYIPFAELEGWKRLAEEELKEKATPYSYMLYLKEAFDERMVEKLTQYKISEHFAELWGLYISNSPVLTEQERKFFGKVKEGFETNPKEFAKQVARDPMMLLRE